MRVEVQLVNERGRGVSARERTSRPKYHGALRMQEARSHQLGRIVVTAELISCTDGSDAPVVPVLHDADVLFLRDGQMRIRGTEFVDGAQFGQTWDVKVQ